MKWHKKGRIYSPDKSFAWSQLYAMMPTPVYLEESETIRIYFGTTDADRFGRTTFLDVDAGDPLRILQPPSHYILDLGKPGTFDDSGAVPSSVVSVGGEQYLYYVGFQRVQKVPYMLFSGLAVSDNWTTFQRYSEAPVIDRSSQNIYSNAAPFVLVDAEERCFKMWFWLGKEWVTIQNKLYIKAAIHYATSPDGKRWSIHPQPCIEPEPATEFSVGRPWVRKENGRYQMFYSVRYIDKLYRLAYAESADGIRWERKDHEIGIDVSLSGWDSEMICYPAVITVKDKTYLFYNGNNNGETGFGFAELVR